MKRSRLTVILLVACWWTLLFAAIFTTFWLGGAFVGITPASLE